MADLNRHGDDVHVPQLIAIALTSACVGLGLVYALAKPAAAMSATQTTVSPMVAEPDPSAPAPEAHRRTLAARPASHPVVASSLATRAGSAGLPMSEHARARALAAKRASASAAPVKRLSERHVEHGAVTYVRCDGLARQRQGSPCPRDRALENAVWASLQSLPQCRNADPGTGQAEVRLIMRRGGAAEIDLKPWGKQRGLNLRAVSKCTGPTLTKLRTRLTMQRSVVSFRFGLE